ncbi:hypothetical protein ACWEQ8_29305 [Streptomyces noursei]
MADRAAFEAEVRRTPAQDLHRLLARRSLPAEAEREDDAIVARLEAGDFTGARRRPLRPRLRRGPGRRP